MVTAADRKQMVIMVGGPASGKGFFLGEPEKYKQKDVEDGKAKPSQVGKVKPGTGYGKRLPKSTKGLFTSDDIPDHKAGIEESDNDLRAIQYVESVKHHKALQKAHKKGPEAFKKALNDLWYLTKDGKTTNMASQKGMSYDTFDPKESHKSFYKKTLPFYRNMRGWHDDAKQVNPETGKPKERFKDEARKRFEKDVARKVSGDKDFVVVDSAGEDIDVQNFQSQIEQAKANGYEVSVVFLDIDREDVLLSNMSRGYVAGNRMVDQQDIDNFYDKYEEAVKKIKEANPDRFLHFKRRPPLTPEERAALRKRMEYAPDGTPTILVDPNSPIKSIKDLPEDQAAQVENDVKSTLYKPQYELDTESSWMANHAPAKPFKVSGPLTQDKDSGKVKGPKEGGENLNPDQYKKKYGKCPDGYRFDGKRCRKKEGVNNG